MSFPLMGNKSGREMKDIPVEKLFMAHLSVIEMTSI